MEQYELEKLRGLPIEGVAERLGLHVSRHKCLCPFHDDHRPSMSLNVAKNTFRCFVCGAHGGPIDLAMRLLPQLPQLPLKGAGGSGSGASFLAACRWLADENGVILMNECSKVQEVQKVQRDFDASRYSRFFERPWLSPEARRFLFDERMLDPRVVSWCRLTSWQDRQGVHWLQIPYYNMDGKLVGIQNRNLSPSKSPKGDLPDTPRFKFPAGSKCGIYNLPVLKYLQPSEPLFITEGSSDCWAMLSSGRKAIAIPSATLLKPADLQPLADLNQKLGTTFGMFPDRDEPGERLYLQLREVLPNLVHHQLPPTCKDFSDYYIMMKKAEKPP